MESLNLAFHFITFLIMKPKNLIIVLISFIFIYFLYSTIKVLPKMFQLVKSLGELETNQKISDTIFVLNTMDGKKFKIYLNKKNDYDLIFIPKNDQFKTELIEKINKDFNQNSIIVTSDMNFKALKHLPFPVYYSDTTNYPLKHKKINIPYRVLVRMDTVFKAEFIN